MIFRLYDEKKDKKAVHRIWHEVGWIGSDKKENKAMDIMLSTSRPVVAELNGEAECLVITTPGTIRYLKEDLPLCAVTGVTTSRISRKQGFAGRLTAQALSDAAANGALVAGLGIFDQGFYNLLGFGNGAYEHWISFDPSTLKVDVQPRVPQRFGLGDWKALHTSRLQRLMKHGNCSLTPPEITRSEMMWTQKGFGLGYYDGPDGTLSHHIWCKAREEHGPYTVNWFSYQSYDQLMELLALIKQWGDQVHLVNMDEPSGLQMQDLINQPFRHRNISRQSKYENKMTALAYWQIRMLDIQGCLAHTHLHSGDLIFNLKLDDPIASYLDEDAEWKGLSGDYIISLGKTSSAQRGINDALPTLTASVGAFTRLWMGILPATSLSLTDDLSGPIELLENLDWLLRLPIPHFGWDY